MPTETDPVVAMLECGFREVDQVRCTPIALPEKLAELRTMIQATLRARPLEIGQLAERFSDVACLLPGLRREP